MSDVEKQFDPTPHHRRKMREQGRFANSREMVQAAGLLAGMTFLYFGGLWLMNTCTRRLEAYYTQDAWTEITPAGAADVWNQWLSLFFVGVFPLMTLVFCVTMAASLFQSGFLFLPGKMFPDMKNVSPANAAKRIFSRNTLMTLLFGVLKMTLLAAVGVWILTADIPVFLKLTQTELLAAIHTGTRTLLGMGMKLAALLFLLSLLDYAWQRRRFEQELRMTYQEMREELRVTEGDPDVKAEVRRRMRK